MAPTRVNRIAAERDSNASLFLTPGWPTACQTLSAASFHKGRSIITPAVAAELARLEGLTTGKVAARFREIFGEHCRSNNKRYLLRRIAWRLQAEAEGGLSERAQKRAEELANVADIRITPPKTAKVPVSPKTNRVVAKKDERLPPPGCWIEREYHGGRGLPRDRA
jgi:hypothetical protein